MEKVQITFLSGDMIEAEVNGSCFIVDNKISFPKDLSAVTITENGKDTVLENVEVIEPFSTDRYWFAFNKIPAHVIAQEKTDAQIMYTALMTNTLL